MAEGMAQSATRRQVNVNGVIGTGVGGELFVVGYIFDHGDGFTGAVGSSFYPVSAAEVEYRRANADEYFEDVWREAVAHGGNTQSLDEFTADVLSYEGDEALFDFSYMWEAWPVLREAFPEYADEDAFPYFDCSGGGRMFGNGGREIETVVNPTLLQVVELAEAGDFDGAAALL